MKSLLSRFNCANQPLHYRRWFRYWAVAVLSMTFAGLSLPVSAQRIPPESASTTCAYDPESGLPNPLQATGSLEGQRELVVLEFERGTRFVYREFPALFISADITPRTAYSDSVRTLLIEGLSIDDARQLLVDEPAYYAELLGLDSVDELGGRTYETLDASLTCRQSSTGPSDNGNEANTQGLEALPDGNYRVTSARLPFRVVTTEELLQSGGTVFRFRKVGDQVVGDFYYPETDESICISGTLTGSIVTGRGRLDGTEATVPDSDALTAEDQSMGGRFSQVVLDLTNFSRINAGTVLPRETCE